LKLSVSHIVPEIFSVKEWRDIETGGRGRSLKMAPFVRSYTTFCWSAIVSMLYHFRVIWRWIVMTLKKNTGGHSNWYRSKPRIIGTQEMTQYV